MSGRAGYLALLRHNRPMRQLWLSQLLSQIGDWFNMIALFHVVKMTGGSSEAIGLVLIIHSLPAFLLAPLAGWVADRFDRRRILVVTDLTRLVLVLGYLVAVRSGSLTAVFILMAVQHSVSAFFEPAKQALVPAYASGSELMAANSLYGATWSLTNALGSMLGGLAVAFLGVESAFVLDALTFLGSALFVIALPAPDAPVQTHTEAVPEEIVALVRREPMLGAATALKGSMALYGGGYWALLVLFGQDLFPIGQGGSISVGLLNAMMAIGALIGATAASRAFASVTRRTGATMLGLLSARALLLLGFALAPSLWVACLFAIANTACGACVYIGSTNVMHLLSPDSARGRLFAYDLGFMTLAYAASVEITGASVDRLGVSIRGSAILMAAIAATVAVAWVWVAVRWPKWKARRKTCPRRP